MGLQVKLTNYDIAFHVSEIPNILINGIGLLTKQEAKAELECECFVILSNTGKTTKDAILTAAGLTIDDKVTKLEKRVKALEDKGK